MEVSPEEKRFQEEIIHESKCLSRNFRVLPLLSKHGKKMRRNMNNYHTRALLQELEK